MKNQLGEREEARQWRVSYFTTSIKTHLHTFTLLIQNIIKKFDTTIMTFDLNTNIVFINIIFVSKTSTEVEQRLICGIHSHLYGALNMKNYVQANMNKKRDKHTGIRTYITESYFLMLHINSQEKYEKRLSKGAVSDLFIVVQILLQINLQN